MKQSFIQTYCSDTHVFTDGEPTSYCHLNTAEPVLQLYSNEDHSVHLHLSLLSITSLTAAVRLNLIMDGKRTSRLSLPEHTERMRKTMMTPLNHTILNKSRRTCAGQSGSCCVCSKHLCGLLSMRTTTCNTFTQSKTFYISCCQHFISFQIFISHVYNYMLIFDIAYFVV